MDEITFDDFQQMDLRTGRVTEAAPVEGADKLICLQVDLGFEERQVLAGIAEQYAPAEMETVSASAAKRAAPADGWGGDAGDVLRYASPIVVRPSSVPRAEL